MKSKISIGILSVLLLTFAYCTPKIGKEVTRSGEKEMTEFTAADIERGNQLMREKCGQCHVLFEPVDFKIKDWEEILKSMLPKSKLTGADAAMVREYIIRNARDSNTGLK